MPFVELVITLGNQPRLISSKSPRKSGLRQNMANAIGIPFGIRVGLPVGIAMVYICGSNGLAQSNLA